MSDDNFKNALKVVLEFEGGFVDDPVDPGWRTNYGITRNVYNYYRGIRNLVKRDVKLIDMHEV